MAPNHRSRKHVFSLLLVTMAVALASCGKEDEPTDDPNGDSPSGETSGKPVVYVVNYPLQYFTERIAGDLVDIRFPAPGDGDPAFWEPDAAAIAKYQQADLILLNGATYAKWVAHASLPTAKTQNTSLTAQHRYIEVAEEASTHKHQDGTEHSHAGTAFTTWLDPTIAVEQARAVMAALSEKLPDHADQLEKNFAELQDDLLAFDKQLAQIVEQAPDTLLVASHPVYQYLQQRYDLKLKSVQWEPETVPDEEAWQELSKILADHPAKWMLWEGEPVEESVAKLKELGVESVVFDPCGNVPDGGDFLSVMRANVDAFAQVFKATP